MLRQREIVSRLSGPHAFAARYRSHGRGLSVAWTLPEGSRLTLIANFGPADAAPVAAPRGRLIWGTAPQDGALPPWTTLWSIESPTAA